MRYLILIMLISSTVKADWNYKKTQDSLTDETQSFASAYKFDYKYNNDYIVSFMCIKGKVRFDIDVDTLINSKSKPFNFIFRVDKKEPQTIKMMTFANEVSGGFTYDAENIALDILGGNNMFVRTITYNNDYLEANISLSGSDKAIKQVFNDCGISLDQSDNKSSNENYSWNDFQSEYNKLNKSEQKKLLKILKAEIKKIK